MTRVSVRDVAEHAGVSVGTVSHVLNHPDKVAATTVERVNASIQSLGYVRNAAARQLRSGRSLTIGAIVLDVANPFFADVIRGAESAADAGEYSVLVGNSDSDASRQSRYLDLFEEQRVDGVLITPVGDPEASLRHIRGRGTPVILVDAEMPGSGLTSVSVDDVAGAATAIGHLVGTGRRRLAFVGGPALLGQMADRWVGASAAAAGKATLERIDAGAMTVLAGRAVGERLAARPAKDRPDGVFCTNDLLAVGVMQALLLVGGIRIPEDIALVGYDDIDFASATMVPLTSIRQPAEQLGRTAVEFITNGGKDGERIRFQPELVVRESTRGH